MQMNKKQEDFRVENWQWDSDLDCHWGWDRDRDWERDWNCEAWGSHACAEWFARFCWSSAGYFGMHTRPSRL